MTGSLLQETAQGQILHGVVHQHGFNLLYHLCHVMHDSCGAAPPMSRDARTTAMHGLM